VRRGFDADLSSGLKVVYALEPGDMQAFEVDTFKGVYKAKTKEQTGIYLKLKVGGGTATVKKAEKLKILYFSAPNIPFGRYRNQKSSSILLSMGDFLFPRMARSGECPECTPNRKEASPDE
jgi:hypothetical protein